MEKTGKSKAGECPWWAEAIVLLVFLSALVAASCRVGDA